MSAFNGLSVPDKEWLQAASTLPPTPEVPVPLDIQRHQLSESVKATNQLWDYPRSGLQISDIRIPVPGGTIQIRTYIPESSRESGLFPVLVWFHGGGFSVGDLELDDGLLRLICGTLHVCCVNIDYRLAPEHRFPVPLEDCYAATKWVLTTPTALTLFELTAIPTGGVSAGANIAAVIALRARDDPLLKDKLTGQVLQVPSVCPHTVYPEKWRGELLSMDQNKDAPLLTRKDMEEVWDYYGPPDLRSPDVAPLLAMGHQDLPSTYLQICGLDPLWDEGLLYEKVLRESRVLTKVDIYPGLPHGFWEVDPLMSSSRRWRADVLKGIQWSLSQDLITALKSCPN